MELTTPRSPSVSPTYIVPKAERPLLSQGQPLCSIPVINLNNFSIENGQVQPSSLVQKVMQACEEYGFFQIVNHGVPENLCNQMLTTATEFFQLPFEERAEFFTKDHTKQVKLANFHLKGEGQEKVTMWSETFAHPCHPIDDFLHLLPTNPPQYREVVAEYAKEIRALGHRLLSLISQGLGLEKDYLQSRLGEKHSFRGQANYYPPCPDPELTLGLPPHTDMSVITILRQTEGVAGLQIIRGDKWVSVDPVPKAFVINLGDQLQVLSNGRYKSVHHRVVTNKDLLRVSMALFYTPNKDTIIGPIEDLIDAQHPPLYRNYQFAEFLEEFHRQEGTRRRVKEVFLLQQ